MTTVLTDKQIERSLCNFVTAARAVQQTHAEYNAACETTDGDAIKLAFNMRESALDLLDQVSPYPLVREVEDGLDIPFMFA